MLPSAKKTTIPAVVEVNSGEACTEESLVTSDEILRTPVRRRRTQRDALTTTTAVVDVVEKVGADEEPLVVRLLTERQMELLQQRRQSLQF
jgi:hypothetical protein